jgi:hypothetical protein
MAATRLVLERPVIERILEHIGEPTQPPAVLPARSPAQLAFGFDQAPPTEDWPEMDQTAGLGADGRIRSRRAPWLILGVAFVHAGAARFVGLYQSQMVLIRDWPRSAVCRGSADRALAIWAAAVEFAGFAVCRVRRIMGNSGSDWVRG